ncbi:hypothetical protein BDR22DRAFT_190240 [Usnea florida]
MSNSYSHSPEPPQGLQYHREVKPVSSASPPNPSSASSGNLNRHRPLSILTQSPKSQQNQLYSLSTTSPYQNTPAGLSLILHPSTYLPTYQLPTYPSLLPASPSITLSSSHLPKDHTPSQPIQSHPCSLVASISTSVTNWYCVREAVGWPARRAARWLAKTDRLRTMVRHQEEKRHHHTPEAELATWLLR